MKTAHHFLRLLTLGSALVVLRGVATAQVVSDGTTNILSNVTNAIVGAVTVGTNGDFTGLVLTNGAFLTNSGNGTIGQNLAATSNYVTATGANTRWSIGADLRVGNSGSGNRLEILNGALVDNDGGFLGVNANSSDNSVTVSGVGSYWSNRFQLRVGDAGSGNRLEIRSGGVVGNNVGILGNASSSSDNSALVTGVGSLWTNRDELRVGVDGARNLLVISNGGTVFASNGVYLGLNATSTGNRLVNEGGNLVVQNAARTGVLDVRRGTNVLNGGLIDVDMLLLTSSAGVFEFNGGTLITRSALISNSFYFSVGGNSGYGPATWDVRSNVAPTRVGVPGGVLFIGSNAAGSALRITNGATLLVTGSSILGETVTGDNNSALVSGPGSFWNSSGSLWVGDDGSGNRVTIQNGGRMANSGTAFIGNNGTSGNNQLLVTGAGSVWTNLGTLYLGLSGSGNRLSVSNGGLVINFGAAYVGWGGTAFDNEALVNGTGSVWSVLSRLTVGENGDKNRMVITNGGFVVSQEASIGNGSTANSNVVLVTGLGSYWSNQTDLVVGDAGTGNRMTITNGGYVASSNGIIGSFSLATNSEALVTGSGSFWSNRNELRVGESGNASRLVVSNGGTVFASNAAYLGFNSNFANHRIVVEGGNLLVQNATRTGVFDVRRGTNVLNSGLISVDNLVMTNPAGLFDFNGGTLITRTATISNGQFFIVGAGGTSPATWDVRSNAAPTRVDNGLSIGEGPDGNSLLITNGATLLVDGGSLIGAGSASSSNFALVSGTGSFWSSSSGVLIGSTGPQSRMIISDGGRVGSYSGTIGSVATSDDNEVLVTGAGSSWSIATSVNVGSDGSGNRLVISNGGVVATTFQGAIGVTSPSNEVLVTGVGSVWSNGTSLKVGDGGSRNRLLVTNGGLVTSVDGFVGFSGGSSNNEAVIAGAGSRWVVNEELTVGGGDLNRLVVMGGGFVEASNSYLGFSSFSDNNEAVVADVNSVWSNRSTLYVGYAGDTNRLVITNGGRAINDVGSVGFAVTSTNNQALVTGAGSLWSNRTELRVGESGDRSLLIVSNSGTVFASNAVYLGFNSNFANHRIVVDGGNLLVQNAARTGVLDVRRGTNVLNAGVVDVDRLLMTNAPGKFNFQGGTLITRSAFISNSVNFEVGAGSASAVWDVRSNNVPTVLADGLTLGRGTAPATLLITNGATLAVVDDVVFGLSLAASNNSALISGTGSQWRNGHDLVLGLSGGQNLLVISNGGTLFVSNRVYVGLTTNAQDNRIVVQGGTLRVTNSTRQAALEIRRGTNVLNSGFVEVDQLLMTLPTGRFEFNGGTLNVRTSQVANAQTFFVGNGVSNAVLNLVSNGQHSFANNLTIRTNALLTGTGTIFGAVTNFGNISPGTSPGNLRIDGSLFLQPSSRLTFELGGLIATNQYDQITVTNFVNFAGNLSLQLLPGFLPEPDDSFTLLKFATSSGTFSNAPFAGRVSLSNNLASFTVTYTFTNLAISGVAYADTDGDGQGDLQEAVAGTNPNDSSSVLGFTSITRDFLGRYVLQFRSAVGKTYRVEYSNNLQTWQTVTGPTFTIPSAGLLQWVDDGTLTGGLGSTGRSYRIGVQ